MAPRTKVSIAKAAAVMSLSLGMSPARALPSTQPDDTYMVNGPVRAVVAVGSHIWVGGNFTQVLDGAGKTVAAVNDLAVFDDATGALDTSVGHLPSVNKTTGTSWVYDLSVAPDGQTVYLAGAFNRVDGKTHVNLARFDGTTGVLDDSFLPLNAPVAKSVLTTDADAYVGGR